MSCYISPNSGRTDFLSFLDDLEMVGRLGGVTLRCAGTSTRSLRTEVAPVLTTGITG